MRKALETSGDRQGEFRAAWRELESMVQGGAYPDSCAIWIARHAQAAAIFAELERDGGAGSGPEYAEIYSYLESGQCGSLAQ